MFPEEFHPRQRKTWGKTPNAKNMWYSSAPDKHPYH
jgi:hypothetical protein